MRLTFLYQPVTDVQASLAFYRDELGWEEAWREGDETVALWLPGRIAQVMLSTTEQPAGPMYLVDDLQSWIGEHPKLEIVVPAYPIPGGAVAGFGAPAGNVFYVFDQPDS